MNSEDKWVVFTSIRTTTINANCTLTLNQSVSPSLLVMSTDIVFYQAWSGVFSLTMVDILINGLPINQSLLTYQAVTVGVQDYLYLSLELDAAYQANQTVAISISNMTLQNDYGEILCFIVSCLDVTPANTTPVIPSPLPMVPNTASNA